MNNLSDNEREALNRLLDQIIPPNLERGVPGAGQLGVGEFVISSARGDAEFGATLRDGLKRSDGDAAKLNSINPETFAAIQRLTYMGYYCRSEIRPLFNVSARPVHPVGYEVEAESEEFMAQLTAPVVARGKNYRDA